MHKMYGHIIISAPLGLLQSYFFPFQHYHPYILPFTLYLLVICIVHLFLEIPSLHPSTRPSHKKGEGLVCFA